MGISVTSISFIFEAILLASLLAAIFAQVSIRLACRMGLMDQPLSAPHKTHSRATPLAGGLALVVALVLSELVFNTYQDPNVAAVFVAGGLIFVFGLWDDYKRITPAVKFLGQILATLVLILMGVSIQIFESPEFFLSGSGPLNVYLDWLLTFLWVIGITNAFNFVDSMDGLSVGLGGLAAAFFMLVTLDSGQPVLSRHSALILGACIGLYFFNSPPAQLFLGDSGAQTLGFILAALAIAYRPVGANQSSSWVVPIMLLGIPIFDMALVVLSRLRRGRPIYISSLDHTYHRLLAFGWDSNRAVLFMHVVSLLLGCLAFVVLTRPPLLANGIFVAVLVAGALAIGFLDDRRRWR
jgi:UDP-GlcNAc:undecaprenyl-phosphate GlcNAc-1-phosphate transferase